MKGSFSRNFFLNKIVSVGSLLVIIISFFMPPDGLSSTHCGLKLLTGAPCPACGLTRSISSISQMRFLQSFYYHPLGFLFYIIFLMFAMYNFFPQKVKVRIQKLFDLHDDLIRNIFLGIIYTFLIYGIIRFFYCLLGGTRCSV
ncbi:MAG: hypothetical protein BWY64_01394 [bacterium ADurb.Bin363]|nr:MAG: hypothetical protein BWY64_01394 [bacterium ADurb.Bin363]